MIDLHTPTLLLVILVVSFTLSATLASVARRFKRDGMMYWAWGFVLHTLTYVLFVLRGHISDLVSVVLANTLLAISFALISEGVQQFLQVRWSRWLVWAPVPLVAVLFFVLLGHAHTRIILSGVIIAWQCALIAWQLGSQPDKTTGRGAYFVIGSFLAISAAFVLRTVGALSGEAGIGSINTSNPVQSATFLFVSVALMMVCQGLVLMTNERADERNRLLAMQDELTGLSNRRFIMEALALQLAQARRSGKPVSILMLDVDHFKSINDTYGHLTGDRVLRHLAAGLRNRLREQDMAGRWGGEEFLVVLPDTDAGGAVALADHLRADVESAGWSTPDGRSISLTVSIGVHTCDSAPEVLDTVISAADEALYRAKQAGRNRVEQG
ncbi:diguanylate cyclase AdrA [Comamonadaceae bacterium]